MGNGLPAAVGQAVIGTVLIIIGAFAPLVLFRLLAFVDPGTSSGQAFRASLDAAGGVAGLLGGRGQGGQGEESSGGSGSATATSSDGASSQGEADAAAATQGRLASAMGPVGSTVGALSTAGQAAAAFGADVLGAAGVGHPQPYFATPPNTQKQDSPSKPQDKPANGSKIRATGNQVTVTREPSSHRRRPVTPSPTCRRHRRCRASPGGQAQPAEATTPARAPHQVALVVARPAAAQVVLVVGEVGEPLGEPGSRGPAPLRCDPAA